ncbi:aldehyde dehydrogenase [Mycobacterium sp.]|uniref:aldehyde dehydrogenase n=1 Tax=Mycobacterium sp. TaxID=1785 RepID=UPI002BDC4A6C|nr:aldehyde dehydrogenase [Mycobacterium sp.]HME49461.1 aldehyde dehydrogenase [Mycobacterium sp.]
MTATTPATRVFIGGQFRAATNTVPVIEAATGVPIGDGPSASQAEIDDAVAAAHSPEANAWRASSPAERAEALTRFAAALRSRAATASELVSRENGMPISLSRGANGAFPAALVKYYAQLVTDFEPEEMRPSLIGHTIVRREPVGVVGAIIPWNYPQSLAAMKIAPALAAGCPVVLKAAPETALDAMLFGEAAVEAGLPNGVLSVVPGDAAAGAHLVTHPGVDKVAFTGSTAAGRAIGEACGRLIRPVTLELGGKSAAIILDDADIDATMNGLRTQSFVNNGQTCYLSSRILAPRSRYDEIVDALATLAHSMSIGNPLDDSTEIGPLVSSRQRERVLGYIDLGKSSAARLVAGGSIPESQPRGWFVEPTVFADVSNRDRIAQEEIFGPVLTVIPYDTDADAVDIANASEYGLAGTVWSTDEERATDVARGVHTGSIGVNSYLLDMRAPFGGVKASGLGKELGPEGLDEYLVAKSIYRSGPVPAAGGRA